MINLNPIALKKYSHFTFPSFSISNLTFSWTHKIVIY